MPSPRTDGPAAPGAGAPLPFGRRPDPGDDRPAHLRIEEWLAGLIDSGALAPDDRLPAEVEMAATLGVSRMTLRQALGSLGAKGLLVRKRGRWGGTFIARPTIEYDLSGLPGLVERMRRARAGAEATVVESATGAPSPAARASLRLDPGEQVYRVVRVRSANGVPVALEEASVPADVLPGPPAGPLHALLSGHGHAPLSATEVLEPVTATAEQAALLDVPVGAPLLLVSRTAYDAGGRPVEHSADLLRPDRTRIVLHTRAGGRSGRGPHSGVT